ncbi:Rhodanese-like domain-containing protein [Spinellus fusiger]|nr:Rhodanese-like domain-containing protein [Spinellus fusiger]
MADSPTSRKTRHLAIQSLLHKRANKEKTWTCCETVFESPSAIGRHIHAQHSAAIEEEERQRTHRRAIEEEKENKHSNSPAHALRKRRTAKGHSDSIALQCECDQDTNTVILFYHYSHVPDPEGFAQDHLAWTPLTGKVRIAEEGINATLAGPVETIQAYIAWIKTTPCMASLSKDTDTKDFFKPSPGCQHVFDDLSVKRVDEICPLKSGQVTLEDVRQPQHQQQKLSPEEFHARLQQQEVVLMDTRNYYESRIGHFQGAVLPPIRKFSRFPDYIDRNKESLDGKKILAYCTGGIRCEKATAYMRQTLSTDTEVWMLQGGIHNYLEWWSSQSQEKEMEEVWKGKNYVFDARQGLHAQLPEQRQRSIVGECTVCHSPWDTYVKCQSTHCHLLVLCCPSCSDKGHLSYCCGECTRGEKGTDGVCACERERRIEEMKPLGC